MGRQNARSVVCGNAQTLSNNRKRRNSAINTPRAGQCLEDFLKEPESDIIHHPIRKAFAFVLQTFQSGARESHVFERGLDWRLPDWSCRLMALNNPDVPPKLRLEIDVVNRMDKELIHTFQFDFPGNSPALLGVADMGYDPADFKKLQKLPGALAENPLWVQGLNQNKVIALRLPFRICDISMRELNTYNEVPSQDPNLQRGLQALLGLSSGDSRNWHMFTVCWRGIDVDVVMEKLNSALRGMRSRPERRHPELMPAKRSSLVPYDTTNLQHQADSPEFALRLFLDPHYIEKMLTHQRPTLDGIGKKDWRVTLLDDNEDRDIFQA